MDTGSFSPGYKTQLLALDPVHGFYLLLSIDFSSQDITI